MSGLRYAPYPAYKDSGVEWLGKIPAGWEVKRLKEVATVRMSNVDKKSIEGEESVALCNYTDVYYHDRITGEMSFMQATATPEQVRRFALRAGDVLITKDSESWTDIAVPAVVAEDLPNVLCGYHLAHIRPQSAVYGPYLGRAIGAVGPRDQFRVAANGVTRFGLGTEAITTSVFAVPPLLEQRAIASFLDRETARIDALIAKKERLITLLQERRTALITRAVTKGLDPAAPMKDSGVEWLGEIPAHWEVRPLRWFLTLRSGESLDNTEFEILGQEGREIPVIGGNGVMGYTFRENIDAPCIAIGRVGALCGNVHLVEPPAWITDNALVAENITRFDRRYLAMILRALDLNRWASQSAQPLITGGFVKAQRVCAPPIEEQAAVVRETDKVTSTTDELMTRVQSAITRLNELRTALISAAVTGKIDVREAAQ